MNEYLVAIITIAVAAIAGVIWAIIHWLKGPLPLLLLTLPLLSGCITCFFFPTWEATCMGP